MLGLRTQESKSFERFIAIVETEANKSNNVFFLDTQESVETLIENKEPVECAELSGWLIPNDKAEEFAKIFESFKDLSKWEDFAAWVNWENKNGKISVEIKLL